MSERELEESLRELVRCAPDCDCTAMDHSGKGDRHGFFDRCPPLERYEAALDRARSLLNNLRSGPAGKETK